MWEALSQRRPSLAARAVLNGNSWRKQTMHRRTFLKEAALLATTCATGLSSVQATCNRTLAAAPGDEVPGWKFRPAPATGPLRVHPTNPRYFTDGSGRAIYLTGSHVWENFQDRGTTWPPPAFDTTAYLDFLQSRNHNFIRLWNWEQARWAPWTTGDDYSTPL